MSTVSQPSEQVELNSLDSMIKPLTLTSQGVSLLDQTMLPTEERYVTITTPEAMAHAIQTMMVRGAPAIGIAGAYGLVLSARQFLETGGTEVSLLANQLKAHSNLLNQTRPTAVNLSWAIGEMLATLVAIMATDSSITNCVELLTQKANQIHQEDIQACKTIGGYGAKLVPKGGVILTHCNAGALATGGYGTALGVVRSAYARDNTVQVFADETRPRLQGARLTTWELTQDHIPVTLVTDGMSATLMKRGMVDFVVVGADRIAANGDTANKIGTYTLALAAKAHQIPFYVAAPLSTIDRSLVSGDTIPIEERNTDEIAMINGEKISAEGIQYFNPGFDVTPADYITGIITEKGIARPGYEGSVMALFEKAL